MCYMAQTSQELRLLSSVTLDCQVTEVTSLQDCQSCQKLTKLSDIVKFVKVVRYCQICQKLSKISERVKRFFPEIYFFLGNPFFSLRKFIFSLGKSISFWGNPFLAMAIQSSTNKFGQYSHEFISMQSLTILYPYTFSSQTVVPRGPTVPGPICLEPPRSRRLDAEICAEDLRWCSAAQDLPVSSRQQASNSN